MVSHRHYIPAAGIVPGGGSAPIDRIAAISSNITYADPNLLILLFLFGACLLYALVLLGDALAARSGSVPEARADPESGTAGRDVYK